MSRAPVPEVSESPIPGVIPDSTHVHGLAQQPGPSEPGRESRSARVRRKAHRGLFSRYFDESTAPPRERPSESLADGELAGVSRAWRRQIVSSGAGLTPPLDPRRDHVRGADGAAVTLVEYGDFQSPARIAAARELGELRKGFGEDLRFAFRHFPIGDAHPLALHAAEAAEAAGAQGHFWEMHDLIYGRDQGLETGMLRKFANSLELDLERFDSELADEVHLRHVMEDFQSGVDSGVNGTPMFFINEERLDWDFEMATLERAIERAGR